MKNKTKYYLFITSLVFIGLIVAVGLFLAAGFTANAFVFPQRFGDLPFTVQFAILAVIYFLVFSAVMFTGIFGIIIGGYIENNFRFENLLAALIFLPLASLGPFLIIIRSRWKLVVKGKQIKFTAYFGRTKSFTFADITRVKHGIRYTKTERLNALDGYKDKKKLFYVAENCPGYNEFVQRLKDEGVNIEW